MSIVASEILFDRAQKNGTRLIREKHTDNAGVDRFKLYRAQSGDDANALLAQHATKIASNLEATEQQTFERLIFDEEQDPLTLPDPVYGLGTVQDQKIKIYKHLFVLAMRSKNPRLIRLLVGLIDALLVQYTQVQLRNALGLTQQKWDKLKDRYLWAKGVDWGGDEADEIGDAP